MRLATADDGGPDGRLLVVSRDASRATPAVAATTMQDALERWQAVEGPLTAEFDAVKAGAGDLLDASRLRAPLPRAWQWLDASAFPSHGALMDKALGIQPEKSDKPQMYQGVSDTFYGPTAEVPMADEALGIDFEGEIGILVDEVPMGTPAEAAMRHIRLLVQINDWSLRRLAGAEMRTGFGWIQAKPPCGMAPFAVTPDELGADWHNGRATLTLEVDWNGRRFGAANSGEMAYGFHELVAHAARTRRLVAGTVIGSGTVSNAAYRKVGSSCIAERRGIEIVDTGKPATEFMRSGDRVRMEAKLARDWSPFGVLEQTVVVT